MLTVNISVQSRYLIVKQDFLSSVRTFHMEQRTNCGDFNDYYSKVKGLVCKEGGYWIDFGHTREQMVDGQI